MTGFSGKPPRLDDFFVFCDSGIEFHHGFNAAALGFTAESSCQKLQCLGPSWLPHVLQTALYGSNASLIALQHLTIVTIHFVYDLCMQAMHSNVKTASACINA